MDRVEVANVQPLSNQASTQLNLPLVDLLEPVQTQTQAQAQTHQLLDSQNLTQSE
jgi:hypothetical protein